MAYGQSIVIFLLLVEMSNEYSHNQYFQAWTQLHAGGFAFVLNGTLAAFYAGLMLAYYLTPGSRSHTERRSWLDEEILVPAESR